MSRFDDLRTELKDQIAREQAALDVIARLDRFLDALEDQGVGVFLDPPLISGAELLIRLKLVTPAGLVSAQVVDLVEAPEHKASVPAQKLRRNARGATGPRWSAEEDAKAVQMSAAGATAREIAKALSRPVEGTKFRLANKLRIRIKSAKRLSADRVDVAEARAAHPPPPVSRQISAPIVEEPITKADAATRLAPKIKPPFSVIRGMEAGQVTSSLMRKHLEWLYHPEPNADVVGSDMQLVEMLAAGYGAQGVAEELDWPKQDVIARFEALRGGVPNSVELQARLIAALKEISGGLS